MVEHPEPGGSSGGEGTSVALDHVVPVWHYLLVFGGLLGLTALTVMAAFVDLGRANNVAALGIAAAKATLVALYFMHVRWSSRLVALLLGTALFALAYMLAGGLSDYMSRGLLGVPGK